MSSATNGGSEATDGNNPLLVATIKSINGMVDFQKLAELMDLPTPEAAGKRLKRYLDKIDSEIVLVGKKLGNPEEVTSKVPRKKAPATPKTPKTPKAAVKGTKRTKANAEVDDEEVDGQDDDAILNDADSDDEKPKVKTPTTRGTGTKSKKKDLVIKTDLANEDSDINEPGSPTPTPKTTAKKPAAKKAATPKTPRTPRTPRGKATKTAKAKAEPRDTGEEEDVKDAITETIEVADTSAEETGSPAKKVKIEDNNAAAAATTPAAVVDSEVAELVAAVESAVQTAVDSAMEGA